MKKNIEKELKIIFNDLLEYFGPRDWWPGDTPLEICIGAILTQNTNWINVEKAIDNLKQENLISINALYEIEQDKLAELIRPSGYFNIKAKRLKNFIRLVKNQFDGDLDQLLKLGIPDLRKFLLSVNGIGKETADSMILYAGEKPVFVVDAYTRRLVSRHFEMDPKMKYDEIQEFFMDNLPEDTYLYNEFHALIVELGKTFCKPKPLCPDCPLKYCL